MDFMLDNYFYISSILWKYCFNLMSLQFRMHMEWISEKRKGKTYISNYNEFCLQYSCRYDLHFMPRKFLFPFLFFVQIIIYQLISNELLIYQTVNYMQYDYLYTMLIILLSERSYFTSLAQCNSNELCEWINDATHKIQCLILYRICL